MEEDEKLLPCPFCGGDSEMSTMYLGKREYLFLPFCQDCGAEGPFGFKDQSEAIEAWNTRKSTKQSGGSGKASHEHEWEYDGAANEYSCKKCPAVKSAFQSP